MDIIIDYQETMLKKFTTWKQIYSLYKKSFCTFTSHNNGNFNTQFYLLVLHLIHISIYKIQIEFNFKNNFIISVVNSKESAARGHANICYLTLDWHNKIPKRLVISEYYCILTYCKNARG